MIIDATVGIGRFSNGAGADFSDLTCLRTFLKKKGLDKAVVYSILAREADPDFGNSLLVSRIRGFPELIPSWVLTAGQAPAGQVVRRMKKNNVRLARIFPTRGKFSIKPWCLGELAAALADEKIPLFIDFESEHWSKDAADWDGLIALCGKFPGLSVILVGTSITGPRKYDQILAEHRNLYLETSQLIAPDEIRRLVNKGYGQRLIFGSDLPLRNFGGSRGLLENTGLPKKDLSDIAAGNLLRLIGLAPLKSGKAFQPPKQTCEIIDMHIHHGRMHPVAPGFGNADDIISGMDRCGIRTGMLTSLWSCYSEVEEGNNAVAQAGKRYPGRIYGYLTLDPKHPEEVALQLKKHGKNPVFRGIKFHCSLHGVPLTDLRCEPILQYADNKGWPVLAHAGKGVETWETICSRYQKANFIVAHGVSGLGIDAVSFSLAELCRKHHNLYMDTASSMITEGLLERLSCLAGAEHIVYGSDYALFDFGYAVGCVLHSGLLAGEKALILGGNARRLLRI